MKCRHGELKKEILPDAIQPACPMLGCDPNLRPWMVGDFTGKQKNEQNIAEFKKYMDNPGESYNQMKNRVQAIWQYLRGHASRVS